MSEREDYVVAKYHLGAYRLLGGFVYTLDDAKQLASVEGAEVFEIRKIG